MIANKPIVTILPVTDLKRALGFYQEKLGLKIRRSSDMEAELEAGENTMLYLYEREPFVVDHTEAGWMVDDLMQEMQELKSKGVEFESYDMPNLKTDENNVASMDGWKSAWFKDTEGNILNIVEKAA